MLKTITIIIGMFVVSLGILPFDEAKGLKPIGEGQGLGQIFTTENTSIITPPDENPMMEGTHTAVDSEGSAHQVKNISNTADYYTSQEEAEEGTLKYIHRLINWALGMLAFVALIVVMYGGFQMVTAAGDDAKFKSGKKALKKVTIGIIGIGASWLIISFFFWFVDLIASA